MKKGKMQEKKSMKKMLVVLNKNNLRLTIFS
jgi:hypothetical protein